MTQMRRSSKGRLSHKDQKGSTSLVKCNSSVIRVSHKTIEGPHDRTNGDLESSTRILLMSCTKLTLVKDTEEEGGMTGVKVLAQEVNKLVPGVNKLVPGVLVLIPGQEVSEAGVDSRLCSHTTTNRSVSLSEEIVSLSEEIVSLSEENVSLSEEIEEIEEIVAEAG